MNIKELKSKNVNTEGDTFVYEDKDIIKFFNFIIKPITSQFGGWYRTYSMIIKGDDSIRLEKEKVLIEEENNKIIISNENLLMIINKRKLNFDIIKI